MALAHRKHLLIIANTPSQNTQRLVDAALAGANHPDIPGVYANHLQPFHAGAEQVMQADAILLGTTENFGYMSGALKDFFERVYYPCLEKTQGLPYALYIRAGNDGSGAEAAVNRIITGLKWSKQQPVLICRGDFKENFVEQVKQLAMTLAAMIEPAPNL